MKHAQILPLTIDRAVIEINGGCNYSCSMCPQSQGRGKSWLAKITVKEFDLIVSELVDHGLRIVNLEGSGEPTLMKNLPEYISVVKQRGARAYIYTNGFNLTGSLMQESVDAGLALARFSVIGYDAESYLQWMRRDAFDHVRDNARSMIEYITSKRSDCIVASYHLILDQDRAEWEVEQYRQNWITPVGSQAEIWRQHNWSGVYHTDYQRKGVKKTCGRPFAPEITIRAGGSMGTRLTLAPCCQTLGRDDQADLGSIENTNIATVWNGERYQWLRKMHAEQRFDEIPYCKDCDFLYDDNEVLVWTNSDMVDLHKLKGTEFSLRDYR